MFTLIFCTIRIYILCAIGVRGDIMPTKPVSVYLEEEEIAYLDAESERTGYAVSSMVRFAVKEWIRERKEEAEEKR